MQLVLRDNDIVELPKEIGELARLRELHIQGNRLSVLPPELGMKDIECLYFQTYVVIFAYIVNPSFIYFR